MKEIKVSNMNCANCTKKINMKLSLNDIDNNIDLDNKTVTVSEADFVKATELIKEAGYNPEV